ncbi:cysteine hydrolase family protein [Mucilaginibacter paludis]|uniref:Isochorismatase hydrolase n=1 Tax=Mucilaginibacter paludis DSM 18603 TaxID=714943 RepID=H1YEW4_9SPHI|nr:isochorismatase family cysteine hydrolase [Mucilaginibacter paludis]EHQ24381.1 isochorismatase hydrolase [Mucilaginibacter paludis DSM 18603]
MEQKTQNTALLIMDMQAGIIGMLPDAKSLTQNVAEAIAHARTKKIPVIFVTIGFREGAPEISMNNKSFAASKARFGTVDIAQFMKIPNDIAPQPGEVTVVKRRVSAFTGSDLEVILRAFGTQHIILTGIATSGVVLSTLREAADKDYRITVLADCCADGDEEVHRVLTTKVFPRQAEVIRLEEWQQL